MQDEVASIHSEESEKADMSFKSSECSEDNAISDRGELQVEEDFDKISSMAETDEEDSAYYARDDATGRSGTRPKNDTKALLGNISCPAS